MTGKEHKLIKYFAYKYLPNELSGISAKFSALAIQLDKLLPEGSEKTVTLEKLIEAKDHAAKSTGK